MRIWLSGLMGVGVLLGCSSGGGGGAASCADGGACPSGMVCNAASSLCEPPSGSGGSGGSGNAGGFGAAGGSGGTAGSASDGAAGSACAFLATDVEGDYFLAFGPALGGNPPSQSQPIRFSAKLETGAVGILLTLQSLDAIDHSTPVGDALAVNFEPSVNGTFEVDLP